MKNVKRMSSMKMESIIRLIAKLMGPTAKGEIAPSKKPISNGVKNAVKMSASIDSRSHTLTNLPLGEMVRRDMVRIRWRLTLTSSRNLAVSLTLLPAAKEQSAQNRVSLADWELAAAAESARTLQRIAGNTPLFEWCSTHRRAGR